MQAVLVSATSASCASALAVQASRTALQPREQLGAVAALSRLASVFKDVSPCFASSREAEGKARRLTIAADLRIRHQTAPKSAKIQRTRDACPLGLLSRLRRHRNEAQRRIARRIEAHTRRV